MIISAVAFILLAITYLASYVIPLEWSNVYLIIAVFLIILTVIVHQINSIALARKGRGVIIPYLISTVLKLILASGMLIILVKFNQGLAKELVIIFLIYYAVFSALEIMMVNKGLRAQKL